MKKISNYVEKELNFSVNSYKKSAEIHNKYNYKKNIITKYKSILRHENVQ